MTDTFSVKDRTRIMRLIKSENTIPELQVRSFLHKNGLRFRIHNQKLIGKPDIVLRKYKTIIFVHGCFWHQHSSSVCKVSGVPKSNRKYWLPKLSKTVARDKKHKRLLKKLGWNVQVIWECQINDKNLEKLITALKSKNH